jgi:hypothetical protein
LLPSEALGAQKQNIYVKEKRYKMKKKKLKIWKCILSIPLRALAKGGVNKWFTIIF